MAKPSPADKKRIKELQTQIKPLQAKLEQAHKLEGKDPYIDVKVKKSQRRFTPVKKKGLEDKYFATFFIEVTVLAEQKDIFIPLSIASGKKTAGFMYQIEGTGVGTIDNASVRVQGDKVSQVTVGTLLYAKIPVGKTGSFEIRAMVRGVSGKAYKLVFTRLNYKLQLADVRY
jgi:hypothetical protein